MCDFKRRFPRGKSLSFAAVVLDTTSRSRLPDHFKKRVRPMRYTGSRLDASQAAREDRNAFTIEDYAPKRFAE